MLSKIRACEMAQLANALAPNNDNLSGNLQDLHGRRERIDCHRSSSNPHTCSMATSCPHILSHTQRKCTNFSNVNQRTPKTVKEKKYQLTYKGRNIRTMLPNVNNPQRQEIMEECIPRIYEGN